MRRVQCQQCPTVFEAKRPTARFCSPRCRTRAYRARGGGAERPRAVPGVSVDAAAPDRGAAERSEPQGGNSAALGETLGELRRLGRVERVDAAAVQALQSMAGALDEDPWNAPLWRQYREALRELMADDSDSAVSDALDDLFAEVRDEAPPGA